MSRKPPTDAFTRFTSTTPSSASSTPSFTTNPQQPDPSRPTETPAERVQRLRAQHAARTAAQVSNTDRVLARGRRFADIAHRATTYTLLGFSAFATIFATYGLVSLVSHNRTQKRAWIEREMDKLESARASFLKGEADAEQLHLLEQERAGEVLKERHEEEKRRKKWTTKIKSFFGSSQGDKGEGETLRERGQRIRREQSETALPGSNSVAAGTAATPETQRFRMGDAEIELRPAAVADSKIAGVGLDDKGRPVPKGKMEQRVVSSNNTGEGTAKDQYAALEAVQTRRRGGPLDQLAENLVGGGPSVAVSGASSSNNSSSIWTSIFGGGSK